MLTIDILRHGKAEPGENDHERKLTSHGVTQAAVLRETLGHPKYDLVIASSAIRTIETARIVADCPIDSIHSSESLYQPESQEDLGVIRRLTDAIGEVGMTASIRRYQAADATGAVNRFMESSVAAVLSAMNQPEISLESRILVVCHTFVINAVAARLAPTMIDLLELPINYFGDCQGIQLVLEQTVHNLK